MGRSRLHGHHLVSPRSRLSDFQRVGLTEGGEWTPLPQVEDRITVGGTHHPSNSLNFFLCFHAAMEAAVSPVCGEGGSMECDHLTPQQWTAWSFKTLLRFLTCDYTVPLFLCVGGRILTSHYNLDALRSHTLLLSICHTAFFPSPHPAGQQKENASARFQASFNETQD